MLERPCGEKKNAPRRDASVLLEIDKYRTRRSILDGRSVPRIGSCALRQVIFGLWFIYCFLPALHWKRSVVGEMFHQ